MRAYQYDHIHLRSPYPDATDIPQSQHLSVGARSDVGQKHACALACWHGRSTPTN